MVGATGAASTRGEQACLGGEQQCSDLLEPLPLQPTSIDASFVVELDAEVLVKIMQLELSQHTVRVLK